MGISVFLPRMAKPVVVEWLNPRTCLRPPEDHLIRGGLNVQIKVKVGTPFMRQEDGFVEGDGKRLVGGCTDTWLATAVGRVACLRFKQLRYSSCLNSINPRGILAPGLR